MTAITELYTIYNFFGLASSFTFFFTFLSFASILVSDLGKLVVFLCVVPIIEKLIVYK